MIPHLEPTPICRLGKWNSLFVLSFVSGVLFHQTVAARAQIPAAKPAPDVIVFTNGDRLTGTLEGATEDSFDFKSDVAGEITVSADDIKELHVNGKFVALKKNEKITRTSKQPGPMPYGDNGISVADTKSGAPEVIPVKNLANLVDEATFTTEVTSNPGIWYGWHGAISGGISVIESTQTGQNY